MSQNVAVSKLKVAESSNTVEVQGEILWYLSKC